MRFSDKTAIVTGAGGGLGLRYAQALAAEGARVVLLDRSRENLERAKGALAGPSDRVLALTADLTILEEVNAAVAEADNAFGGVDILVNNAGGGSSGPGNADTVEQMEPSAWSELMRSNLDTAFHCIKAVSPLMKRRKYGRIVNVASRSARVADPYFQQSPAYACAKTAILGLTRFSARELGPYGITVNCLVPALTLSGPVLEEYWERIGEAARAHYLSEVALKRLPEMQEMVGPVLFLCSDDGSYVTGVSLDVNGGSYMPA